MEEKVKYEGTNKYQKAGRKATKIEMVKGQRDKERVEVDECSEGR